MTSNATRATVDAGVTPRDRADAVPFMERTPRDVRRRSIPPSCFGTSEFTGERGLAKRRYQ